VKLAPVPVVGVPPGADQENEFGAVPPVEDALQVTGLPAVALPQVTVTTSGWPPTTIEAVADFFALLASVAVTLTTKVPFAAYVVVKLAPVPVAGLPPGADQEKVNGGVPPLAEALQVTGLPTVAVPHVTLTVIGVPMTLIVVSTNFLALLLSVTVALTIFAPLVE